jgi:hypothetical protein
MVLEKNSTVVHGMLYLTSDSVGEVHVFSGSEITRLRSIWTGRHTQKKNCAVSDAQRTVQYHCQNLLVNQS